MDCRSPPGSTSRLATGVAPSGERTTPPVERPFASIAERIRSPAVSPPIPQIRWTGCPSRVRITDSLKASPPTLREIAWAR